MDNEKLNRQLNELWAEAKKDKPHFSANETEKLFLNFVDIENLLVEEQVHLLHESMDNSDPTLINGLEEREQKMSEFRQKLREVKDLMEQSVCQSEDDGNAYDNLYLRLSEIVPEDNNDVLSFSYTATSINPVISQAERFIRLLTSRRLQIMSQHLVWKRRLTDFIQVATTFKKTNGSINTLWQSVLSSTKHLEDSFKQMSETTNIFLQDASLSGTVIQKSLNQLLEDSSHLIETIRSFTNEINLYLSIYLKASSISVLNSWISSAQKTVFPATDRYWEKWWGDVDAVEKEIICSEWHLPLSDRNMTGNESFSEMLRHSQKTLSLLETERLKIKNDMQKILQRDQILSQANEKVKIELQKLLEERENLLKIKTGLALEEGRNILKLLEQQSVPSINRDINPVDSVILPNPPLEKEGIEGSCLIHQASLRTSPPLEKEVEFLCKEKDELKSQLEIAHTNAAKIKENENILTLNWTKKEETLCNQIKELEERVSGYKDKLDSLQAGLKETTAGEASLKSKLEEALQSETNWKNIHKALLTRLKETESSLQKISRDREIWKKQAKTSESFLEKILIDPNMDNLRHVWEKQKNTASETGFFIKTQEILRKWRQYFFDLNLKCKETRCIIYQETRRFAKTVSLPMVLLLAAGAIILLGKPALQNYQERLKEQHNKAAQEFYSKGFETMSLGDVSQAVYFLEKAVSLNKEHEAAKKLLILSLWDISEQQIQTKNWIQAQKTLKTLSKYLSGDISLNKKLEEVSRNLEAKN